MACQTLRQIAARRWLRSLISANFRRHLLRSHTEVVLARYAETLRGAAFYAGAASQISVAAMYRGSTPRFALLSTAMASSGSMKMPRSSEFSHSSSGSSTVHGPAAGTATRGFVSLTRWTKLLSRDCDVAGEPDLSERPPDSHTSSDTNSLPRTCRSRYQFPSDRFV